MDRNSNESVKKEGILKDVLVGAIIMVITFLFGKFTGVFDFASSPDLFADINCAVHSNFCEMDGEVIPILTANTTQISSDLHNDSENHLTIDSVQINILEYKTVQYSDYSYRPDIGGMGEIIEPVEMTA